MNVLSTSLVLVVLNKVKYMKKYSIMYCKVLEIVIPLRRKSKEIA